MKNLSETIFENVWAKIQRNRPRPEVVSEEEAEYIRNVNEINMHRYYFDNAGNYCFDGFYTGEYFLTAFRYGRKTFFGEHFDEIIINVGGLETDDVFDIVMRNDHALGIVELKYNAHENDLPDIVSKAKAFRLNFPDYQQYKIYLGLATMEFYPKLEQECEKNGIAIIKQMDDTVVINDKHLKAY